MANDKTRTAITIASLALLAAGIYYVVRLAKQKPTSITQIVFINDGGGASAVTGDTVRSEWESKNPPEGSYVRLCTQYGSDEPTCSSDQAPTGSLSFNVSPPSTPTTLLVWVELHSSKGILARSATKTITIDS